MSHLSLYKKLSQKLSELWLYVNSWGIIKKQINISKEVNSKIEWAYQLKGKTKIYQGSLKVIEHINLAYVEPNKLVIKNNLYLFFNEHDYFYVNDLRNKYPLSGLKYYIARH